MINALTTYKVAYVGQIWPVVTPRQRVYGNEQIAVAEVSRNSLGGVFGSNDELSTAFAGLKKQQP